MMVGGAGIPNQMKWCGSEDDHNMLQVHISSKSSILSQKIDFVSIETEPNLSLKTFRDKYELLRPENHNGDSLTMNGNLKAKMIADPHHLARLNGIQNGLPHMNGISINKPTSNSIIEQGPPPPRYIIHDPSQVKLEWSESRRIGAGLVNLGNSCFMNSVLQCLTYCPPLVNFLKMDHSSQCKITGFCMLCEMSKHVHSALSSPGQAIRPHNIFNRLRTISKQFNPGRQEDSHEFLRYVVDLMSKSCVTNYELNRNLKLDPRSKETTMINHIFGGYMRSQVTCLTCKGKSNTYDYFMDFILDIKVSECSVRSKSPSRKMSY